MVRRFETTDIEEINKWWRGHGHNFTATDFLPRRGLISPGAAALFWYHDREEKFMVMEGMITNPSITIGERREAGLQVVRRWKEIRDKEKVTRVLFVSETDAIAPYAYEGGAKKVGNGLNLWMWDESYGR